MVLKSGIKRHVNHICSWPFLPAAWAMPKGQKFPKHWVVGRSSAEPCVVAAGCDAFDGMDGTHFVFGHRHTGVVEPGVRVAIQHADWRCVLVPRPGARRYCGCWAASTATTFFWPDARRRTAARTGQPWHVRCHRFGDSVSSAPGVMAGSIFFLHGSDFICLDLHMPAR
jgi:hypothetical protein